MGGLVVDAWLAPIFVAPGSGAFSGGGLVWVGGGALNLAVAGDVVWLCVSKWLLLVDSTASVLCVEGLITCMLAGDCQGGREGGGGWACLVDCRGCRCCCVQRPLLF